MAVWGEFKMANIASQSMVSEFENAGPIGKERGGTPFLYEITGVPLPMEWDYQEWSGTGNNDDPETVHLLQHFIAQDELPDVLLVDDPDEVTLPSHLVKKRDLPSKNSEADSVADNEEGNDNDSDAHELQPDADEGDQQKADSEPPSDRVDDDQETGHPVNMDGNGRGDEPAGHESREPSVDEDRPNEPEPEPPRGVDATEASDMLHHDADDAMRVDVTDEIGHAG